MTVRIVVVGDPHYDTSSLARLCPYKGYADRLLAHAVRKVNNDLHPDVLLVPGDLVERTRTSDVLAPLRHMYAILSESNVPVYVIPGNHDPEPDVFYQVFQRPPEYIEIADIRIVPFVTADRPGLGHWRSPHDASLLAKARDGFDGPIVTVQHVPVLASSVDEPEFVVENQADAIAVMRQYGVLLAIGGHRHEGTGLVQIDGVHGIGAPALYRKPFRFLEIVISDGAIAVHYHRLGSALDLGLDIA